MIEDKVMVNDALAMEKSSLANYQKAITECKNVQLRQTLQQIRNDCETSQYNLFTLAETKGFYQPAENADSSEIQKVKSQFQC